MENEQDELRKLQIKELKVRISIYRCIIAITLFVWIIIIKNAIDILA